MFSEKQIISNLLKNIGYFEYDCLEEKICVNSKGNNIIINKKIKDVLKTDFYNVADDSVDDLLNFFKLIKYDTSKNQVAIKLKINEVCKWYLFSSFPRNENEMVVCGMIENVSSFLLEQDKLKELAKTDSLTGLLNRYSIEKYIEKCINEKKFFYFCMMDLDYFKNVNDTYGHVYGDKVLKQVASFLKKIVGDDGAVGRVGGDEFIIIKKLNESPSLDEKREFCRQIRSEFINKENDAVLYSQLSATISLVTYPFDGTTIKNLVGNADKALYKGKLKGRNCYIIYNEQIHGSIDVTKPYEEVAINDLVNMVDPDIFIHDILKSLLNNSSDQKLQEKIEQVACYFKVDKISIYKQKDNELKMVYKYKISEDKGDIKIVDIKSCFMQFDRMIFNAADIYEYKHDRYDSSKCMEIPYEAGSIIMTCCGLEHDFDYIMAFETYNKRRIWNNNFLMAIKIISRIIITFYLKG